jgi:hypothetical protein
MQRDDGHVITVKGNDGGRLSFDGVVIWLGRRKNENTAER